MRVDNPYLFPFSGAAMLTVTLGVGLQMVFGIPLIIGLIVGLNLAVFFLCGFDKLQARRGALRVPERALLGLALVGGSAGLLLGMKIFRHKTKKASFQILLLIVLLVQIWVLRELKLSTYLTP